MALNGQKATHEQNLYTEIWQSLIDSLVSEEDLSQTAVNLWFVDMRIDSITDDTVYLLCPNGMKCATVSKRYTNLLCEKLSNILGFKVNVTISTAKKESDTRNGSFDIGSMTDSSDLLGAKIKSPDNLHNNFDPVVSIDDDVSIPLNSNQYTFDNFIVGASNRFARAAAMAVAEKPASEYNPLFIHGASGLGKTHLMWSIINYIKSHDPSAKIIYVKGDDFTNQLIECIRHETTPQFREKYRTANILLIDDIQFIAGKESTQEEFFHTFNALYEDHKQIIMTSDRPPKDIKTLEERLRTRFEQGLIADIQSPDYELRMAIMRNKAEAMNIRMPDDVIEFLANNLKSNVRQLEGAIKKLGAQSFLTGTPITIDLAYSCVADLMTASEPVQVTVERILDRVSKKTGVSIEDIKSKKRQKSIAYARHTSIYLIRQLTDMSLAAIGRVIGDRNHTTIMSSLDVIENELKTNPSFENDISELRREIKE
jgi:chromosomal replication initiator protein